MVNLGSQGPPWVRAHQHSSASLRSSGVSWRSDSTLRTHCLLHSMETEIGSRTGQMSSFCSCQSKSPAWAICSEGFKPSENKSPMGMSSLELVFKLRQPDSSHSARSCCTGCCQPQVVSRTHSCSHSSTMARDLKPGDNSTFTSMEAQWPDSMPHSSQY